MADVELDDFDQAETRPGAVTVLANWTGALMSVGLVVGLSFWGYQMTSRDVAGVPVIRALEGPMRVQPEDPGGRQVAHQGLTVNRVQAEGTARPPANRIILAPRPVDLKAEDDPRPTLPAAAAPAQGDPAIAARALADRLISVAAPPPEDDVRESSGAKIRTAAPIAAAPSAIATSVPGVSRSVRPDRRPAFDPAAFAETKVARISRTIDIDPAELTAGTRLVQLGAFDSQDAARAEWDRVAARFGAYMENKKRVIQRTRTGGRVFYRLRVHGFQDPGAARRFCTVLLAENAACIPVIAR